MGAFFESDVAGGPQAAARARGLLRRELAGRIPASLLADVALLVTELVANSVRHGGADEASPLHLRVDGRAPGVLHIEVENPSGTRGGVVLLPLDADHGGGGLGLQLVDRIASRWGVRDDGRTAVWFDVPC